MDITEFGKTTFISILSKLLKNQKILIIDFDLINNNLHSVFGVRKIPKKIRENKEKSIKELAVKVDNNIDLISDINHIFNENSILDKNKIEEMLEKLKQFYDVILIDTCNEKEYAEIMKNIMDLSSKNICLIEGNIIYIRKTMNLLKRYFSKNRIIHLIYNKKNEYTIKAIFLKLIFAKYKMLGVLTYNNKYNKIINKNVNRMYIDKEIKNEYYKIIEKLL